MARVRRLVDPSASSANAQQRFRDCSAAGVKLGSTVVPGAMLVSPAPPPHAVKSSTTNTLCPRYQEAGDKPGIALSLNHLDVVANDQNDGAQSIAYFPASTAVFETE